MKRISFIFLLAGFLLSSLAFSQAGPPNNALEFDHTAVYVRDLQKSAEFYENILGLERIPDPFKDGRHVWFRIVDPKYRWLKCHSNESWLAEGQSQPAEGLLRIRPRCTNRRFDSSLRRSGREPVSLFSRDKSGNC